MPRIHKPIELTKEEKELLEGMLSKGFYQSRKLRRARILLKNHEHHCPTDIAQLEKCSLPTVYNILKLYREQGIERALNDGPRPCHHRRKINPKIESEITTIACSKPPIGYNRWTLRLIRDRYVEITAEEPICHETVRTVLKKAL